MGVCVSQEHWRIVERLGLCRRGYAQQGLQQAAQRLARRQVSAPLEQHTLGRLQPLRRRLAVEQRLLLRGGQAQHGRKREAEALAALRLADWA